MSDAPLPASRMILLGASNRRVGKTTLATRLLARFAERDPVGVKVTTISERRGPCPRGGEGCGACRTLGSRLFCLNEEFTGDDAEHRDTQRMLAAGAHRVFWLRVHEDHLVEGAQALLDALPPDSLVVAESNRLRRAVDPGLFLVLQRSGSEDVKPSCLEVMHEADARVLFDGTDFDFDVTRLEIAEGCVAWRRPISAVVLAGGMSRRMGRDKASLDWRGVTLLERSLRRLDPHAEEVFVSGDPARLPALGRKIVPDRVPFQGPMMAVASALAATVHDFLLVVPVDLPELPLPLLRRLLRAARDGACVAVPVVRGLYEPLFAVYPRSVLGEMERLLASGSRRIVDLFERVPVRCLDIDEGLRNLNTPEDWQAWIAGLEGKERAPGSL